MRLRHSIYTAVFSYLQMASAGLVMLLNIPLALHFLSHEQFGLWSFTSQSLGYLLLLDFGVVQSVSRLMADPLHRGNAEEWEGWFNLLLVILMIQAVVILVFGLLLVQPILDWFKIPASLQREARQLWIMMLILNVVLLPFRLFPGILNAQNRLYLGTAGYVAGSWLGLGCFYLCLRWGCGSLSYGYAALASALVYATVPLVAVIKGPHLFRLQLRRLPWHHVRHLFSFSSAVFVIGIAVQVVFLSQSLIITKFAGLSAVAAFTVCSQLPMQLMQMIWRPYDAFNPRWQIFWCRDELSSLHSEIRRGVRLTMGLALMVATCCLAGNRWFVHIFAKASLYQGKWFDFLFTVFMLVQVWNHCLGYFFVLSKQMKQFALVVCLDSAIVLVLYIWATARFGLIGLIGIASFYSFVSVACWFIARRAPFVLRMSLGDLVREAAPGWLAAAALWLASAVLLVMISPANHTLLLGAEVVIITAAVLLFLWVYREEWKYVLQHIAKILPTSNEGAFTPDHQQN